MSFHSDFRLFAAGKVLNYEVRSTGVTFTTVEEPNRVFLLLDDDVTSTLNDRIIIGLDRASCLPLQPLQEAIEILEEVKAKDAYVIVYAAELFGNQIYKLQYSDVPGYAATVFYDDRRSEKEREEISRFTNTLESNPEFKKQAMGKYIAIVNEKVIPMFFNTPAEINPFVELEDRCLFFRVDKIHGDIEKSTRFIRCVSKRRLVGNKNISMQMYAAHFVETGFYHDGEHMGNAPYMVDTGADETNFPGWYDRSEKKLYTISGEEFACIPAMIVEDTVATAGGEMPLMRVIGKFSVVVDSLWAVEVDSLMVDKFSPPTDKAKNYAGSFLLGRDVLFKLNGCWFSDCDGNVQLSLECSKHTMSDSPKHTMSDSPKHTFPAELATDSGSVKAERAVKPDAMISNLWSVMKRFR